ncbi:MAG: DEAD/DEAH box helicase [Bacteroidia bacterium]
MIKELEREKIKRLDQYELIDWLRKKTSVLTKAGFEIEQPVLSGKQVSLEIPKIKMKVDTTDNDWLDIEAVVKIGKFNIPFIKFRDHILNGNRVFELPDETITILPEEWFAQYKEVFQLSDEEDGKLWLAKSQAGLLNLKTNGLKEHEQEDFTHSIEQPKALQATLRHYQLEGLNWMNHLREQRLGGCLADEMGLGKTLQSIALLLHVKECQTQEEPMAAYSDIGETGYQDDPQLDLFSIYKRDLARIKRLRALIVMPLSLIHNWEHEIARFVPGMKVYKHAGLDRTRNSSVFNLFDVILTTYATLRNDIDIFAHFGFNYLILDESQHIKNPKSKTYKAITEVEAQHRLVLTGTPIENSISDLWAQMNFVNPGMLGSYHYFKNEFIYPVEKERDEKKREKLRKLISPFILRRRIRDVAQELPERNEQVFYTEMETRQKKLYEEEKSRARNQILENIRKFGKAKSNILILKSLSRLRQIANHPALVNFDEDELDLNGVKTNYDEEDFLYASGKFQDVTNQLDQIISEGHKVLMFSQFVKHLDIYKEWLQDEGLKYSYLIGKRNRKEREKAIDQFQTDPETQVFLISLKAGGTGLNLTAASYVFMLDPWWNPATENQAISRAHRIGQDKNVFAYRFITVDTVEEKIMKLQERKKELASDLLPDQGGFQLTEEEVGYLFT